MEAERLQAGSPGAREREDVQVDVVIVSAEMGEMTLACVSGLDDGHVAEVVVVDNSSANHDPQLAEQIAERAKVLTLEAPLGFAAANNRGLAVGTARYVLLLNSDIVVTAGAIDALVRALQGDPEAVAAGGRLVDPETLMTQAEYRPRPFPSLANFAVILLGIEEYWPSNPVTRRYHGARVSEAGVQEVDQPAAAALLLRRAEIEAVGGFDERFWFWFEDSDLLFRLSRRGRILYVPGAVFRHLGGGTFRHWSKSDWIRSAHHGIVHYGDAHFSRLERGALGALVLAVSLPRVVLFHRSRPEEAEAWRAVAAGGAALARGRSVPPIAPAPTGEEVALSKG